MIMYQVFKLGTSLWLLKFIFACNSFKIYRELKADGEIVSADDYFMNGDVYCYDQTKLTEAHEQCKSRGKEIILVTQP